MKPGTGAAFSDLANGDTGAVVSVVKLDDGYVRLAIADDEDRTSIAVTVSGDVAENIGHALLDAAK